MNDACGLVVLLPLLLLLHILLLLRWLVPLLLLLLLLLCRGCLLEMPGVVGGQGRHTLRGVAPPLRCSLPHPSFIMQESFRWFCSAHLHTPALKKNKASLQTKVDHAKDLVCGGGAVCACGDGGGTGGGSEWWVCE
jgi:hypothetical protein